MYSVYYVCSESGGKKDEDKGVGGKMKVASIQKQLKTFSLYCDYYFYLYIALL